MSCLRIRSSRRSRGPSYTSLTATAKGESLVSFFATVLAVVEEWVGLPEVSTGISTPETAFTSSLILVIVPTTSRFRIVAQVRTPATCPSRHVLPPWWHWRPYRPSPSLPPEYPRRAVDCPRIFCGAAAWGSAPGPGRQPPSFCIRCSQSRPSGSLHLLRPWLWGY